MQQHATDHPDKYGATFLAELLAGKHLCEHCQLAIAIEAFESAEAVFDGSDGWLETLVGQVAAAKPDLTDGETTMEFAVRVGRGVVAALLPKFESLREACAQVADREVAKREAQMEAPSTAAARDGLAAAITARFIASGIRRVRIPAVRPMGVG